MEASAIGRCIEIARAFGVTRLILFGSALSAPQTARDLDVACDRLDGWDLFRFGARLEEELRVPVDVVPLRRDDPFVQYVVQHGRVLYEAR